MLAMTGIRKTFGPVVALDGVDFRVGSAQVHGLLGGNGAGKTTLMNVLYGMYAPDAGSIEIDGAPVTIAAPKDAIAAGVGMVHQSFLQVDTFTVTENVVLGTSTRGQRPKEKIAELSQRFGLAVDPNAVVDTLPVGVRQRVEILKALYRGARLLVLDEPTTNLTPQEVDALFASLRSIVNEGMSVVLITHKIKETMAVCDAMTIMRDGKVIGTVPAAETSAADLASRMVAPGSSTAVTGPAESSVDADSPDRVVVTDLTVAGRGAVPVVNRVGLRLRRGEILAVAGVAGNGQVELAEALTGARSAAGSLTVDGEQLVGTPTANWLARGVVLVPEDRQRDGILPSASITENLVLGSQRTRAKAGMIDWRRARADAAQAITDFSVRTPGAGTALGQLSGGNIQRVILARAFAHRPRMLVLHNPTRGLDIASTQFVYSRLREAAADGCSVVVISEDLDEVLALGDRVSVIYAGGLVGDFARGATDPYELGRLMTGVIS